LPLGGTCVNVGCVPSKALIHYAKNKSFDFSQAMEKVLELVQDLRREKCLYVKRRLKSMEEGFGQRNLLYRLVPAQMFLLLKE